MRIGVLGVLLVLAACGDTAPTPDLVPPPRPALPDGWRTVTTDEGDVAAALPRSFVVNSTSGAIAGFPDIDSSESASFIVIGPTTHDLQPGDTIDDWVEASNWLTGQREGAEQGLVERRELLLPSGRALEFSAAYTVAGQQAWTFLYAIDTGDDISVVRFGGDGPLPADLPDDFALIRDLLEFPGGS